MRSLGRYTGQGGRREQLHPRSADAVARWCGRTPAAGYLFQESASPAVPSFGGANLSQVSDPTFGVATPYPNQLAVGLALNDANRIEAAASGTFDYDDTTSFAFLMHCRFGSSNSAANREIVGKSAATEIYVLRFAQTSLDLQWVLKSGATTKTAAIAVDHTDIDTWVWCACDRNAATSYVATNQGSGSVDITGLGTLVNAGVFRVGTVTAAATAFDCLALYVFEGSAAEGEDGTALLARIARIKPYG